MQNRDLGILILRLTTGGLLLFHGIHKVFVDLQHVKAIMSAKGLPEFFAYGNVIGEFVAPILVLLGFYSRIGGLLIAFNFLMSIVIAHPDIAFSINDYGGWMIELNVFYMLAGLSIFFTGAGVYSLSKGKGKWD